MSAKPIIRIGGASGFWGDSPVGAAQLIRQGQVDYLVFDYLAEMTMSILAAARLRQPEMGYATDFVTVTLKELLPEIASKGVRVVSNAGGMNPHACARAVKALAEELGLALSVAVVEGDDVLPMTPDWMTQGLSKDTMGRDLPRDLVSANAYLGAVPIRDALDLGAQVVITGRCVDSAVTLGVLMHEFRWTTDDHDRLAQASLAGHIIECGCQATGGLHTDWESVPDWPHIGYPIIECQADGRFTVGKPAQTGGLVSVATVGEQILYEIGDPAAYELPDVICDFTQVQLHQVAPDVVSVTGARGRAPSQQYKVSATHRDGFRCNADLVIVGDDAVAKAKRTASAILERVRGLFREKAWPDFTRTHVEVIGSEDLYGPHARAQNAREVVMRLAVTHPLKPPLERFAMEIAAAGTSWSPGTAGSIASGRPSVIPLIRQCAFWLDKSWVPVHVVVEGQRHVVDIPKGLERRPVNGVAKVTSDKPRRPLDPAVPPSLGMERPLSHIAYARSGDKGDVSNIGLMARRPEWVGLLRDQVTPERLAGWLSHLVKGPVTRYELPGLGAFNYVCENALDGGGMSSLRADPLGKAMAQIALSMPVHVPFDGGFERENGPP